MFTPSNDNDDYTMATMYANEEFLSIQKEGNTTQSTTRSTTQSNPAADVKEKVELTEKDKEILRVIEKNKKISQSVKVVPEREAGR